MTRQGTLQRIPFSGGTQGRTTAKQSTHSTQNMHTRLQLPARAFQSERFSSNPDSHIQLASCTVVSRTGARAKVSQNYEFISCIMIVASAFFVVSTWLQVKFRIVSCQILHCRAVMQETKPMPTCFCWCQFPRAVAFNFHRTFCCAVYCHRFSTVKQLCRNYEPCHASLLRFWCQLPRSSSQFP